VTKSANNTGEARRHLWTSCRFPCGVLSPQKLVDAVTFISNTAPVAPTKAATFLYETAGQDLFFDEDGSGAHAPVKIAHFDTAAALKANDFDIAA
jgi:hypothetical protein